jgi:hypothetical protein
MITLRNELAQRIRQLLQRAHTPIVSTWTSSVVNAGNGVYTTRPVATGEVRIFLFVAYCEFITTFVA